MIEKISKPAIAITQTIEDNKKVLICANGGSLCDSMHFTKELFWSYRQNRKDLPAIAITDPSHITCVGNYYGFDFIFSRYIEGIGQPGDVLLGITTSGNSQNIINALIATREKRMSIVILTENYGGQVVKTADQCIIVPHLGFADRIQEIHINIIDLFLFFIEKIHS
jgi:D-sedoheptulose 7-phosphate isomerase